MTANVDPALLEMFTAEVDAHMASLNDGLLALEQDPAQSQLFEALMRAAHSIKGAAKLVGLQAAVDVAHVIEDSFVAAREGRLAMTSGLVDVLLAGVDLLGRAAQFDAPAEQQVTPAQVAAVVQQIVAASRPQSAQAVEIPAVTRPSSQRAPTADSARAEAERQEHTQHQTPRARTFLLQGALDDDWVRALRPQLVAVLDAENLDLELDLSGVTEIEPLALALWSQLVSRGVANSRSVAFQGTPPRFAPLLRAAGFATSTPHAATER